MTSLVLIRSVKNPLGHCFRSCPALSDSCSGTANGTFGGGCNSTEVTVAGATRSRMDEERALLGQPC